MRRSSLLLCLTAILFMSLQSSAETLESYLEKYLSGPSLQGGELLSPALSLSTTADKGTRTRELLSRLSNELLGIRESMETGNPTGFQAAIGKFDEKASSTGANVLFESDNGETLMISRSFLFLPKEKLNGSYSEIEAKLMKSLVAFKKIPKGDDTIYFYSEATNPAGSSAHPSNENSPNNADGQFTLKKCRRLLGWRCNTNLYQILDLSSNELKSTALIQTLINLKKVGDSPTFQGDGRTKNQTDGNTKLEVLRVNKTGAYLYSLGFQYVDESVPFQGQIRDGFIEEQKALREHINKDLGI